MPVRRLGQANLQRAQLAAALRYARGDQRASRGVPVVYLGVASHWAWVTWRVVHLDAILFVAAESLLGIACPLYGIVAAPMKSSITEFHRSCHAEA